MVILDDSVDFFGDPILNFRARCKEVDSPVERSGHGVVSGEIIDEDVAVYFVLSETSETS